MFRSRRAPQPAIVQPPISADPLLVITHDAQRFFCRRESTAWNHEFAGAAKFCCTPHGFTVMHGGMSINSLVTKVRDLLTEYGLYDAFGTIVLHGRYNPATKRDAVEIIKAQTGPKLHILSNDYTQSFAEDARLNTAVGADNHCQPWLTAWEQFLYSLTGVRIADFRFTDWHYPMSDNRTLSVMHAPSVDGIMQSMTGPSTEGHDSVDRLVDESLRRGPNGRIADYYSKSQG